MKFKRLTAFAVVATMVLGSNITAFATSVDGQGAVEYDNSVDVTYDSITLPTLTASKYDFTLDPRDELHTFDTATYARGVDDDNPGVYFHSEKAGAKIEKSDATSAVDIFKLEKAEVASGAADWKAVVTAVTEDEAMTPTVTPGYYVWTPAEFASTDYVAGTTPTGKKGVFTELDATNVKTYFEIGEKDQDNKYEITMKADHLANGVVCDGKLYRDNYVEITTAIQDNPPTVTLKDYVELAADGKSIESVVGVYKEDTENGGYIPADPADIKFTEADVVYQNVTDKVVVTNKSTNKKTVKAVVTMSNIDGLEFNDSDDFTDVKTASIFVKATDGTADNDAILEKGETTATATYTLDVDGADVKTNQIKYQGGINTKTGGHDYFNYPAYGTTYNSNSFWITANANTNGDDDSIAAWKAYGKALEEAYDAETGAATPKMNIVYTVTDYQEPVTQYTVTYHANYTDADPATATEDVDENGAPTASGISFTRDGYTFKGWGASASATEADKVTLSDLTITENTDLYAIWEKNPITGYAAVQNFGGSYGMVLLNKPSEDAGFTGLTEVSGITSYELKYNDGEYVDAKAKAMVYNEMIGITYADARTLLGFSTMSSGDTITIKAVVGDDTYISVFTNP